MNRPRNPTGFVRQHPDTQRKRWQGIVKYPDPDQPGRWKTRSKTFERKAEAQQWVDEALAEHRREPAWRPPSEETFAEFYERWLNSVAATRVRDTTVKAYRRYGAPLIQALGQKPLKSLSPSDFQTVYAQMLMAGRATSTIHHTHVVAHSALDQAVAWGLIPANPTDRAKPPRVTSPEIVPPTVEELRQLFDAAADDRLRALWWLIALTGMRKGEALALKWSDVDWERQVLRITRTVAADGGLRVIHDAKTAAGRRTVALSPYLLAILKGHQEQQALEQAVSGPEWNAEGWIFCSENGTLLWPANVNRRFRALRSKAGLPDTVRIHDLRHAMATIWLSQGVPVKVVSERLGHANVSITLQIYGHLLPTMQAEAARQMDTLFAPGVTTASPGDERNADTRERR
ncbi:MAG: tyrosine-type recombinase/integrase [Firmicutes bacterium]|nr:tyrosine-type recombinase/integrase [Alicyclobacillaceae bacterium]MCL6497016.1 tyrosine-type recombinase/integrase [Bacillota bacterium]